MSGAGEGDGVWVEAGAAILDPTGLHARPAVKLTKLAKSFSADIQIRAEGGAGWINAKSPNAVMKLRAGHGTMLAIRARGADASEAAAALARLVERDFDG